jgi:hypothetical protein
MPGSEASHELGQVPFPSRARGALIPGGPWPDCPLIAQSQHLPCHPSYIDLNVRRSFFERFDDAIP